LVRKMQLNTLIGDHPGFSHNPVYSSKEFVNDCIYGTDITH
jgi:hypothetical protein